MTRSQSIKWLTDTDVAEAIASLQTQYSTEPINITNYNPIGYVLGLSKISYLFDDDRILLAKTIIRSIIKGHPLQDGNKRLGMLLGEYFLALNGLTLTALNDSTVEIALNLASGAANESQLLQWLRDNIR